MSRRTGALMPVFAGISKGDTRPTARTSCLSAGSSYGAFCLTTEKKAAVFKAYMEAEQISGVDLHEAGDAAHAHVFRSNLPVQGQSLPFMILVDDSVYTVIQLEVAAQIVTEEKKERVAVYLNALNDEYRMLKYSSDAAGNVLLTCSIPSGVEQFEPALIAALLNQIQEHLNEVYPDLMAKLWSKEAAA